MSMAGWLDDVAWDAAGLAPAIAQDAPLRHELLAEGSGDLGLTQFTAGGGDQRFNRTLSAIRNRYLAHVGAGEYLQDSPFHGLGDSQCRDATLV
jgi:hypothetical protein